MEKHQETLTPYFTKQQAEFREWVADQIERCLEERSKSQPSLYPTRKSYREYGFLSRLNLPPRPITRFRNPEFPRYEPDSRTHEQLAGDFTQLYDNYREAESMNEVQGMALDEMAGRLEATERRWKRVRLIALGLGLYLAPHGAMTGWLAKMLLENLVVGR